MSKLSKKIGTLFWSTLGRGEGPIEADFLKPSSPKKGGEVTSPCWELRQKI